MELQFLSFYTIDFGLHFTPQGLSTRLTIYSDDDWLGRPDSRHSTTYYLIYLGSNLIFWCSKKMCWIFLAMFSVTWTEFIQKTIGLGAQTLVIRQLVTSSTWALILFSDAPKSSQQFRTLVRNSSTVLLLMPMPNLLGSILCYRFFLCSKLVHLRPLSLQGEWC